MKKYFVLLICALAFSPNLRAHDVATAMSKAAKDFLAVLDADQQKKASYELKSDERTTWFFVPRPFEGEGVRNGIPLAEIRHDQRLMALALLSTGMSHEGYVTALQIMSLEQVLWEMENKSPKRNPEMYYVSIFGKPGAKNWGWSVEGHHLSMNFTITDGKVISGTPIFFASNPGEITEGPRKGLRVLAAEEDVARAFVKSLDADQTKLAKFQDKAPRDILTAAETKVAALGNEGIPYNKLSDAQKKDLGKLIDVYVRRLRSEVADEELAAIRAAGMDKIVFAWAGGFEKGEQHYYRVQGPTFLLEYANTQNNAAHVHAVWRDFDGDFGRDTLGEHFAIYHAVEKK